MKNNFEYCVNQVLSDEGSGYTNDTSDSGGPTKYGITQKDTKQDIHTITMDEAKAIYKTKYWDALSCDTLPSGVDYTCFDYGVNSGIGRPRKALQRFSNLSGNDLIDAINNERATFLKKIGTGKNSKFLKGWLARVQRVRNKSHYLSADVKDNKSGPTVGTATGISVFASLSHFVHTHPYLIISGSLGTAVLVGTIIHLIRNK